MKVNILGTKYDISLKSPSEDEALDRCDGYCDKTTHQIVVTTQNGDLGNFSDYQKKCLRHEIIHAFMFESGLAENWEHKTIGQEETKQRLIQEVNEGEEALALAVCNKVNRDTKLAKVYIDQTFKSVSASCEFFYTDMESLKNNVEYTLVILGMVRSAYYNAREEFVE